MMIDGEKEWGSIFQGGSVKVGNIYMRGGSLTVIHRGPWHEVGDSALAIIKSMDFKWENKVGDYRRYFYRFKKDSAKWVLDFDVVEWPGTGIQPKETALKIHLDQGSPREVEFPVIYLPKVVNLNEINLEDLLKSSLYRLPHIAGDLSHFASWVHLMNENYIVVYHDRYLATRIDVVMKHSRLPYYFVIAYHIDKPYFSADLHVVTGVKSYFDTLAESVVDEYWSEITGRGGER
jgi:hypothetical protein